MKKIWYYFITSIFMILISCIPMFDIIREYWIENKIINTYEVHHAYTNTEGFEGILDVKELQIDNINIKIKEEETGSKFPLTALDKEKNIPPKEEVKIHLFVNNNEISTANAIWASNEPGGGRYFSWLDLLTVKNKKTGEKNVYFVQRLTDDNHPMEKRKWKLIKINQDGSYKEESISYSNRSSNYLGVELINYSDTSLMSMGYYSDVLEGVQSIFAPILYPIFTSILGIILLLTAIILKVRK
ncbi:hypothetical protein CN568_28930 [Bacillus pseudomycoides]|uniref:hypothetical protein n=1 Tax=Bacillus pseudomycoides TaxID=64104 RepID=UPI000BEE800E|nr:hypothetical protein [Bacillus pseudomycoides]PDZ74493.1 hypothetical protein CON58_06815 [Bacillus pseudomycoides]PEK33842.1 hypothetical protein CN691_13325 [Bacillus pseudomycoides]PEK62165.1 hypothetical protein CN593_25675 [Bacillus pseudomycoides]PEP36625.1 hypothetical protein CN568_28930 [Bacillus pseudomycoides]PEP41080.1 hypothetical protein CN565_14150 [Bacillus pseudomycoides]